MKRLSAKQFAEQMAKIDDRIQEIYRLQKELEQEEAALKGERERLQRYCPNGPHYPDDGGTGCKTCGFRPYDMG